MLRSPWWRIGWRNLGRNRRRTLFTTGGLALGFSAVVVMGGLNRGLIAEMIGNGTGILDGQLQVHSSGYLPERSLYETIGGREGTDVERLVDAVAADPAVRASAPRVFAGGLVSSGDATVAVALIGIDPGREAAVSTILSMLDEGRLPRPGEKELVVGREMARQLSLSAGDETVLVAPAADGSMGNDLFTVTGIFDTGLAELDRGLTLLPIDALQRLIALPESRIHEIAARVDDPWQAPEAAARLAEPIAGAEAEAEVSPWTTFRPEMVSYSTMAEGMEWMLLVIVFAIAIFGVANTMLMATFERRHEFALLLALGTAPSVIVRSVLAEAVVLSSVSLVVGAVITAPILVWWHLAPPDMSWLYGGTTLAGGLMRPILRVEYPWLMILEAAGALFLTAVFAALYPAWRSARVPPADTLTGR